jgi:hypothetical protein
MMKVTQMQTATTIRSANVGPQINYGELFMNYKYEIQLSATPYQ